MRISYVLAVSVGTDNAPSAISLSATNHGPGEVTLHSAVGYLRASWLERSKRGIFKSYLEWPHSLRVGSYGEEPKLPVRLTVGENVSVVFPESILATNELKNMGFIDGYGREHFADKASARNLRRARKVNK